MEFFWRVKFLLPALINEWESSCHQGQSPFFQTWAEGLQKRGKSKMSVICAVMRKLVHVAYGVLKNGKPFDPEWAKSA